MFRFSDSAVVLDSASVGAGVTGSLPVEKCAIPERAFLDRQTARDSEPPELLGQRTPGGCLNDSKRFAESALLLGPRQHCSRVALF